MISLPDFKEKQILFINADWNTKSVLRFCNGNIVFYKDNQIANRASVYKIFSVFILGDLALTTGFIREAKKHGISIFFFRKNFYPIAGLLSEAEGNYLLRAKQYHLTQEKQLKMAKKIVKFKILNQISLLNNVGEKRKNKIIEDIELADDNQELLGIEGSISRDYFKKIFKEIGWRRRAPQTKEDIPNYLLDMGYTFLFNFVDSLLRLHGFDTYKGFYHQLFFQRRSLSCDMMEPFRPLIDRQIIKSFNLKQIQEKDFELEKSRFTLPFQNYSKYSSVFFGCLMENKETIFNFIHDFYRHMMDEDKNAFPTLIN